jgi:hypothetical protein
MAASKHRFTIQDNILILDSEARIDPAPLIELNASGGYYCKVLGVDNLNTNAHRLVFVINPMHMPGINKIMRGIEYELGYRPHNRQIHSNLPIKLSNKGNYLEVSI